VSVNEIWVKSQVALGPCQRFFERGFFGILLARDPSRAANLRLEPLGAVLFVGLLLLWAGPLFPLAAGQAGIGPTGAADSPHAEPLVPASPFPPNLAGVNGTTWEDSSGGTCADCTYSVYLSAGGVSTPNSYFLAIWYLSDPACAPAVGQELVHLDIGGNGTTLNDNPGSNFIELCTRASNPIVQDCGQSQLWYV